jgi:hypothetical protein
VSDTAFCIGREAFNNCTNLISVTFEGKIVFDNFNYRETFPDDLRNKYLASNGGTGTYKKFAGGSTWKKQYKAQGFRHAFTLSVM